MGQDHCRLIAIPADLQHEIIQLLLVPESATALRSLNSTCSFYRDLLAPHIFKAINLVNTIKNGDSVNAVATGKHAENVRELHYRGSAPGGRGNNCRSKLRSTIVILHPLFEDAVCILFH